MAFSVPMASGKAPSSAKKRQSVRDCILTAIDQLKQRKARPDRYRIAYVLNKQFGVEIDVAKDALEQMTDEHKIVRVDYKGSVSYRDIKNWIRVNDNIQGISMYAGAIILNSDRASAAIHEAVKSLTAEKKTPAVTLAELDKYFKDKAHNKYTTAPLPVALQREVNAGHLLKTGPEAFTLKKSRKPKQKTAQRTDSPTSEGNSDGNDVTNENGKRVKKTKVIFDPSESPRPTPSEPPPPKRLKKMATSSSGPAGAAAAAPAATTVSASISATTSASASASANAALAAAGASAAGASPAAGRRVCNFCHKPGKQEVVLVCCECQTPAHPSCLGYSKRLAKMVQDSPWTCMDCKTCKLCRDVGGELIFCDKCDEAYHMSCHRPPVRRKPIGEWMCVTCRGGRPGPGRPPKLAWKPVPVKEEETAEKPVPVAPAAAAAAGGGPAARRSWPPQLLAAPVDATVPDASEWSSAEVAAYFSRHGFGQHAAAFQKHEVDGAALLMMARMDVLRGLGLKLGPALKIYNHVKLLQTRRRACLDFCLL